MDQFGERRKLRRLEVLWEIHKGGRLQREWFAGEIPSWDEFKEDRGQATKDLLQIGFIEEDEGYPGALHPRPFLLTVQGQSFLKGMLEQIGVDDKINWNRVNEVEFPALEGRETSEN
jgi:hypothetical protein